MIKYYFHPAGNIYEFFNDSTYRVFDKNSETPWRELSAAPAYVKYLETIAKEWK